ncbi:MAG: hypothetical protein GY725_15490 [bacterium]|nr:hypothetical protein [bacterium]
MQIVSRWHHSSVGKLLRAEGLYEEYKDWLLVDFSIAGENGPAPEMKQAREELPKPGALLDLVA